MDRPYLLDSVLTNSVHIYLYLSNNKLHCGNIKCGQEDMKFDKNYRKGILF